MPSSSGHNATLFGLAAYFLGLVGVAAFYAFLVLSGLELWSEREPLSGAWPWIVNAGLLLVFALQHSGMARQRFKSWLARRFPAHLERSLYVGLSGLIALAIVLAWQPVPGPELWRGPKWLIALNLVAAGAIGLCCARFHHSDFFGLRQAWQAQPLEPEKLTIAGPYRFVRHPLMAGLIMCLWVHPVMTPTLAVLSGGLTVYILLALPLEEHDLLAKFGRDYEEYRHKVPALIPWKGPAKKEPGRAT